MMTKRDFERTALTISKITAPGQVAIKSKLIEMFTEMFTVSNPRFDAERFHDICNPKSTDMGKQITA